VLAVSGVACWAIVYGMTGQAESSEYLWTRGCASAVYRTGALRYAEAWGGLLVFDCVIFTLTLYKSLLLRATCGSTFRLLGLMLRDGSVYFGVMVICNIANILMLVYGGPFLVSATSAIVNNLSSVMITRLMLNMRDPNLDAVSQNSWMTTLGFHIPENLSTLVEPDADINGISHVDQS